MIRSILFGSAQLGRVNRAARFALRKRLLVVCYHGVCGERADVPDAAGIHVPARRFADQLDWLAAHYRPVSLSEVVAHLLHSAKLPSRALLITFDDGYRNLARNAFPLLRAKGIPAALFPVTGPLSRGQWLWTSEVEWRLSRLTDGVVIKRELKRLPADERRRRIAALEIGAAAHFASDYSLLTWDELARAVDGGLIEVGSHGVEHEPLTTCSSAQLTSELAQSRLSLETRLQVTVTSVAYPNGDHSPSVRDAARQAGYAVGFTTGDRHHRPGDDPLQIPRILVGAADDRTVLAARLSGWREWLHR